MLEHKWFKILLPILGGALYSLGFPSFIGKSVFFVPIIGFSLLFYYLLPIKGKKKTLGAQLGFTLLFSLGYYQMGYYWIPTLFTEFGRIPFPVNHLLGYLFPLVIIPHILILALFIWKFQDKLNQFSKPKLILILSFLTTILEYFIPQQFPAHMGHTFFILKPYFKIFWFLGIPTFSFAGFWMSLELAQFFHYHKRIYFPYAFTFSLAFISILLGPVTIQNDKSKNIRIVQANIGNYVKIQAEGGVFQAMEQVMRFYKEQSLIQNENFNPDLIIWPETAYPIEMDSKLMKENKNLVPFFFQELISKTKTELFLGGYDLVKPQNLDSFEDESNTAFHFSSQSELKNVYHKIELIPFGETLPFGPLNRSLSKKIRGISFFQKGSSYTLFSMGSGEKFISPICYEILFSKFMRKYLNKVQSQPDFIINLTNDSWYGDTMEPHQHQFLAHWRAIELNLPIVRSTNTGITSILYPSGEESKRLNIGDKKTLDEKLYLANKSEPTLFQQYGLLPLYAIFSILYFFLNPRRRRS